MDAHPGEKIIFEGHPSWRSILDFYFKGLLVAAVGGGIGYLIGDSGGLAIGAIAVVALTVVIGLIKRIATTYSISNQRLHIRRGIVARKIQETRIDRVQNVNISQGVIQRIIQIGTVDFDTAGTGDSDFSFTGVAQPEKVMRAVEEAQRESAAAQRDPGPAGPAQSL